MTLFDNTLPRLSIVEITKDDVNRNTDAASIFSQLIAENETMYPDIDRWIRTKVFPGISNHSRVAFLALNGDKPVATAVIKRAANSKFCHLKVNENFQNNCLGEFFFVLMAFEVRNDAKEIHFTLPSSLWESDRKFFKSFGFHTASISGVQYRLFDQELVCSASFPEVWSHVLEKLPKLRTLFSVNGFSLSPRLLFSIKSEYAKKIIAGEKNVEIRTRFSKRWVGHRISIYASGKSKELIGEATISNVCAGEPNVIWSRYNKNLGCSYDEYKEYAGNRNEMYAIELENVIPYLHPIPITQIEHLSRQTLNPPQSYLELNDDSPWTRAVSIAGMLHARMSCARKSTNILKDSIKSREYSSLNALADLFI